MNNVNIIGRLGQDPEIFHFENGCKAKFSVAVDARVKRVDEWTTEPMWIDCVANDGLASNVVANFCKKGKQIGVTGALKVEKWQDKATGGNRSKLVVAVKAIDLLDSKKDGGQGQPRPPAPQVEPVSVGGGAASVDYEEIPF